MFNELIIILLYGVGMLFFIAGSVGLLRFPDFHSRLHSLTKADNVGLGCIALGTAVHIGDIIIGLKIMFVWILVLIASSLLSFLIAQHYSHQANSAAVRSR